ALIIGAETLSKMVDWKDRSTCILFGDGAGACILKEDRVGILSLMQKSDGSKSQVLYCKNRETHNPYIKGNRNPQYMVMNGQEVYKFALKKVPESIKEVVEKAQVELDTIKYFILHQANKRILFSVAKRLSLPIEKFPMNLDQCGNTSAASIPILLDEMNQKGMLKQGDKVVLSGFGGGLTWAGTLLEW
ncbi:MAG TPA: 3-oxoacyl-ACP synthase, partial [Candidatus Merdenecus merdavium]|nr:3-oxoacyl-ACP synthase [Candidatus Merdenecus merdavium]